MYCNFLKKVGDTNREDKVSTLRVCNADLAKGNGSMQGAVDKVQKQKLQKRI